jgi:chitinase
MSSESTGTPSSSTTASRTRISVPRLLVVLLATLGVVAGTVLVVRPIVTPVAVERAPSFSPYVDVTATPSYAFETPRDQFGQNVTLAFVVAAHDSPCRPEWGAYYSLAAAGATLDLDRRIAQLRSSGGDVRVSFGGALNQELAVSCQDSAALASAYRSVVDRYSLNGIDLDLEGATLADTAALARRATAVATVQRERAAQGRALAVWLTLPVATDGLTDQGVAALTATLQGGVAVAGVNGMAMDFGGSKGARQSTADAVIAASTALHAQVRTALGQAGVALTDAESWSRVGITPMIGQSDVASEQLTIADAQAVNAFARSNSVGLVSFWSLNRDSTCAYPLPDVITVVQTSCSGINQDGSTFASVLGAGLAGPSATTPIPATSATASATSSPAVLTDDPATSPFPIWDSLTEYVAGTKVVWHREVYRAAYYSTGVFPDAAVVSGAGTPWVLVGPVLPGETPAPLPTLPAGTYPQWDGTTAYPMGSHVQVGTVPYVARFWSQGQQPGIPVVGGSPWTLMTVAR